MFSMTHIGKFLHMTAASVGLSLGVTNPSVVVRLAWDFGANSCWLGILHVKYFEVSRFLSQGSLVPHDSECCMDCILHTWSMKSIDLCPV